MSRFTLKFHLVQNSFNLHRRVCSLLAFLDSSTMSLAYIRQDMCKPLLPSDTGSHSPSKQFVKSFRFKEKSVGLKTQPCLTPILNSSKSSKELLRLCSVFIEYINFWYIVILNYIQK